MTFSCVSKPHSKFKFKSCSCEQSAIHVPCQKFNFSYSYKADSLLSLLHTSYFVLENKNDICCLKILELLAKKIDYKLHRDCEINPYTCFYDSYYLYDTLAYLYRYDLRKLVSLYHHKDSLRFDQTVYMPFKDVDNKLLNKYKLERSLNDNLSPKYNFIENCRIENFPPPDLKSSKGIEDVFSYLLWEDSTLFVDYGYIVCKKNYLIWSLATNKNYVLHRFKDGSSDFEFYLNGCYLSHNISTEYKTDLRMLMQFYNFKDSSLYIKKYWK